FFFCDFRSDQLFDNEEGSDVTFKVGVEPETWRFPGHSSVLRNNPVFKAMLAATPDNVITIPDVDGRAFDLLLRCIYNQEVKLQSVDTALYTLYAAQKYMCTSLMKRCLYYLDEHMSVNNVLQVYQHMRVHSGQRRTGGDPWEASAPPYHQDNFYAALGLHTSLTNNCLHYIDTHADQVMAQESIEDLSAECLRELVERDTLDVSSEVSVYWALERWSNRECKRRQLEMSPENRRSVLSEELLFAVRFLTMNKDQFYVGPLKGDLLTKQEITVLLGYILGHNSSSPSSAHCLLPVLSDIRLRAALRRQGRLLFLLPLRGLETEFGPLLRRQDQEAEEEQEEENAHRRGRLVPHQKEVHGILRRRLRF
ncbi:hypothetical protein AAG570_013463, partial [Ranatra chinensis]